MYCTLFPEWTRTSNFSVSSTDPTPALCPYQLKTDIAPSENCQERAQYMHRHACQTRTKPSLEGVRTQTESGKSFVTQLNWALYILWLFSISDSVYICLPLLLAVPLCLTLLCSVNCELFLNATVNGINGKQNLARIVLACTVCLAARGVTLNVLIICTHHSQNVMRRKRQQF